MIDWLIFTDMTFYKDILRWVAFELLIVSFLRHHLQSLRRKNALNIHYMLRYLILYMLHFIYYSLIFKFVTSLNICVTHIIVVSIFNTSLISLFAMTLIIWYLPHPLWKITKLNCNNHIHTKVSYITVTKLISVIWLK